MCSDDSKNINTTNNWPELHTIILSTQNFKTQSNITGFALKTKCMYAHVKQLNMSFIELYTNSISGLSTYLAGA